MVDFAKHFTARCWGGTFIFRGGGGGNGMFASAVRAWELSLPSRLEPP